jgi:hypothetical protein
MIAQIIWFTAGYLTAAYADDVVKWIEDTFTEEKEVKLNSKEKPSNSFSYSASTAGTLGLKSFDEMLDESLKRLGF